MKRTATLFLMGVIIMLSSCSSSQLESYKDTQPQLKLEEYFNGPLKAWGMVQGRTGKVNRRFEVDMVGQWQGDTGKLHEKFHFYDGERMERTWTIRKLADGTYEGTAGDVIGKADGKASGMAVKWKYTLDLPVGGKTYHVVFDDWMFLMEDGVLINRSYLSKFGFRVGELTIFMQKLQPAPEGSAASQPGREE